MVWFALFIPFFSIIVLATFFKNKVVYWEYAIVVVPSILFIWLLNFMMVAIRTTDTEYLGYSVVGVKYYEDWNEWITRTCTRSCGKNCTTTYDCSYCDYHSEYWVMVTSQGHEIMITKSYYDYLLNKFATVPYFIDMNRNYYTNDGDCYETDWSGSIATSHAVTESHWYENKIQATHSVFHIEDVSKEEYTKWKLYNYPEVENNSQDYFIGYDQSERENNKMHYLNGRIGELNQLRVFIVVFNNTSKESAYKQRSHWQGFNKNELVICIGVDSLSKKVQWSKTFSWMDVPVLAVDVDSYITSQDRLNMESIVDHLIINSPKEWKRKSFKDFDYLTVEVTGNQLTWIVVLLIIINSGISYWVITNQYEENRINYKNRRYY